MISTKEELQYLLHRAWEIEKKFESLSAWKSFISIESKYRSTVLTLARESHQHQINLEKILKTLGLEAPINEIPEITFNFNGLLNSEILQKIIQHDEIARELYIQILENIGPQIISVLIYENDVALFNQQLKQMIQDETRHIAMVRKLTSEIKRIQ